MQAELQKIASRFALEGAVTAIDSLGEGFINDTFIIRTEGGAPDYILQRKNKNIFPDVPAMMENIRKVTDHIRRRVVAEGGDPLREVMTIVPTRDGHYYAVDSQGDYWAVSVFIGDTIAYNKADSPELARKGGEGIGGTMAPPQIAQGVVVKALHAHAHPVEAGTAPGAGVCGRHVLGVDFYCGLDGVGGDSHGRQSCQHVGREHRRRAAAEVNGLYRQVGEFMAPLSIFTSQSGGVIA